MHNYFIRFYTFIPQTVGRCKILKKTKQKRNITNWVQILNLYDYKNGGSNVYHNICCRIANKSLNLKYV